MHREGESEADGEVLGDVVFLFKLAEGLGHKVKQFLLRGLLCLVIYFELLVQL